MTTSIKKRKKSKSSYIVYDKDSEQLVSDGILTNLLDAQEIGFEYAEDNQGYKPTIFKLTPIIDFEYKGVVSKKL